MNLIPQINDYENFQYKWKGKRNIIALSFFSLQTAALFPETHSRSLYFTSKQDAQACSYNIIVAISPHTASTEISTVILPQANEVP